MKRETLFIADLHLSRTDRVSMERFLRFVETRASGSERLYILGDLFDAYLGDDDPTFPNYLIKDALKRLSDSGTAIFFQHGNRDFLVGERFCRETGITLLGDYAVIDLYGKPALVTHGDLLCSDDVDYQAARMRVRAAEWQRNALAKPLFLRQLYARWYRFKSRIDKRKKTEEIMDANGNTVIETMRRFDVDTLIHGHTHRPAIHELDIDGRSARRIVLDQWGEHGQVLSWDAHSDYTMESVI